ncbi:MAG: hypothetical protein M3247_08660 [Thermoproteota archaeon]|nr:hypothetical protein [Thermoproteota archaeon]
MSNYNNQRQQEEPSEFVCAACSEIKLVRASQKRNEIKREGYKVLTKCHRCSVKKGKEEWCPVTYRGVATPAIIRQLQKDPLYRVKEDMGL